MIEVRTGDGRVYEGETPVRAVRAMKNDGWQSYERKREYMSDVAKRVEQISGELIVPDEATEFLRSLEEVGVVSVISRPSLRWNQWVIQEKEGRSLIQGICNSGGHSHTIEVNTNELRAWVREGQLVQDALVTAEDAEREFLVSGICGACFDELFAGDED